MIHDILLTLYVLGAILCFTPTFVGNEHLDFIEHEVIVESSYFYETVLCRAAVIIIPLLDSLQGFVIQLTMNLYYVVTGGNTKKLIVVEPKTGMMYQVLFHFGIICITIYLIPQLYYDSNISIIYGCTANFGFILTVCPILTLLRRKAQLLWTTHKVLPSILFILVGSFLDSLTFLFKSTSVQYRQLYVSSELFLIGSEIIIAVTTFQFILYSANQKVFPTMVDTLHEKHNLYVLHYVILLNLFILITIVWKLTKGRSSVYYRDMNWLHIVMAICVEFINKRDFEAQTNEIMVSKV